MDFGSGLFLPDLVKKTQLERFSSLNPHLSFLRKQGWRRWESPAGCRRPGLDPEFAGIMTKGYHRNRSIQVNERWAAPTERMDS